MNNKLAFIIVEYPDGKGAIQFVKADEAKDLYDNCHKTEDKKLSRMTLVELSYSDEKTVTSTAITKTLTGFPPKEENK
jgi:hypothetical protein